MTSNTHLLAAKPEIVFPLAPSRLAELRQIRDLAIGEMAGRDSVAAILKAMESDDVAAVLPTAVYTGTEYGDWQGFERNAAFLRHRARQRFDKPIFDLVWMGSPQLWRALNGRYLTDIAHRFGGYSPCLACHFYIHALRIPLALQLGARVVIAGDRARHNQRVKLNQLTPVVALYRRLFHRFGLELREPLHGVADAADLEPLLGPAWPGGSPQPTCLFSGSDRPLDGGPSWAEADVTAFVEGLVYPVLDRIIDGLVTDRPLDYDGVVAEHLLNWTPVIPAQNARSSQKAPANNAPPVLRGATHREEQTPAVIPNPIRLTDLTSTGG